MIFKIFGQDRQAVRKLVQFWTHLDEFSSTERPYGPVFVDWLEHVMRLT